MICLETKTSLSVFWMYLRFSMTCLPVKKFVLTSSLLPSAIYEPGTGWGSVGGGYEYQHFHVNPKNPEDVYLAGSDQVRRVSKANRAWQIIDPEPTGAHDYYMPLAFHPTNGDILYAGIQHVWRSTNRGTSWTDLGLPMSNAGAVFELEVAPSDARVLYVLTRSSSQIWKSTDEGATWTSFTNTVQDWRFTRALAIAPDNAQTLWVGRGEGLYRSTDGGASIQRITSFPTIAVNYIRVNPANAAQLFVATAAGVLLSTPAGATWRQLGAQLPPISVTELVMANNSLYAANNQGIWQISLSRQPPCSLTAVLSPLDSTALCKA